ncbi:P-loop containing nucleoside triphosphate hydrolase protein [Vararia minispora EC-137]|uniref:P-loop containing nucleoside triphosphate hydrolase protein n=1 Tax=Vararia minispora EC-137 TaxID=1314806 RepID=A0ACB8QC63_9AGAM|nr:P-loop containing nucleoside triphosphate hydrolase protein [Vararia minispora EC-137]
MDDVDQVFDYNAPAQDTHKLLRSFLSPPLDSNLQKSVHEFLGPDATPTPIQSLALEHLLTPRDKGYRQVLLASETGSGKSLAYLLPVLQHLKRTELAEPRHPRAGLVSPRALVLAPTHELARQLAYFAKQLVHHAKLRVQTASRPNVSSLDNRRRVSASKMSDAFEEAVEGEFEVRPGASGPRFDVDVLVGTPSRLLEMSRGHGWRLAGDKEVERERGRPWRVGRPEMDLHDVEWVVIDEADVLLNRDFVDDTRALLADAATARGYVVPAEGVLDYPFHMLLTSATIPLTQTAAFAARHPRLKRLVSPGVHRLPKTLKVEFAQYGSGSKMQDVERRLRELWEDDALAGRPPSRVVVFTNARTAAHALGAFLEEKKIPVVTVAGWGDNDRAHGSNKHLAGFIGAAPSPTQDEGDATTPRVLVSTAVLARGLDFTPDVSTVFLYDAPRTAADFLHRAGRTARGGREGRVVVFERGEGRGTGNAAVVRQSIAALANRRQVVRR